MNNLSQMGQDLNHSPLNMQQWAQNLIQTECQQYVNVNINFCAQVHFPQHAQEHTEGHII